MDCVCCGAPLAVDPAHPNWSIRTEVRDGVEVVVERHLSILCPQCGRSETTVIRNEHMAPELHEDGSWFRFYNLVVEPVDPPVALVEWGVS